VAVEQLSPGFYPLESVRYKRYDDLAFEAMRFADSSYFEQVWWCVAHRLRS
jgi:hypothetical protein